MKPNQTNVLQICLLQGRKPTRKTITPRGDVENIGLGYQTNDEKFDF